MTSKEKHIQYTTTNSYSTLNKLTKNTKHLWFVFHGMGYLSRYFIRHFKDLNAAEHYIVALQAPSKYYQGKEFRIVGASWLTKENTQVETNNVLSYVSAVYEKEVAKALQEFPELQVTILGFSQGVSIASRFVAFNPASCKRLILHSGGIPKELTPADFKSFEGCTHLIYGTEDHYLDEERIAYEKGRALSLFENKLQITAFKGGHDFNLEAVSSIL